MQLGMIGLRRMGGDMSRLMRAGTMWWPTR